MRPSSAKAKGRRLQQYICQEILAHFPELEPDDVRPAIMGESGEDVKLSPRAREVLGLSIEAKNVERLNIWDALKQAEANAPKDTTPVLVFTRNRTPTYVAVPLGHYLWLRQEVNDPSSLY